MCEGALSSQVKYPHARSMCSFAHFGMGSLRDASSELQDAVEDRGPNAIRSGKLWFSVVDCMPDKSVRAMRGNMASSDISISIH